MKSRNILVLMTLFFCFCLSTSYSNDYDERALLTTEEEFSYDVGDEDSVRNWEKLRLCIEESVNNNKRMYFKNLGEVQYAQQFNYISDKTGKITYKPKVNKVTEISEVETVERLGSETDAILHKPKVNKVAKINEVETVEKVDYSETDEILHKPRKKGCCCM